MSDAAASAVSPAAATDAAGRRTSIYAFLRRPSLVDFPGRLAAVFFTTGCNYRCGFCHNFGQLGERRPGLPAGRLEDACRKFADQWVNGVVVTGGEPTLNDDLAEMIEIFRRHGFAVKLDTNGSRPAVLRAVLPRLDMVAMDLKCAPESYREFVAWARPETVRECADILRAGNVFWEARTTILPNRHDAAEMRRIGAWIGRVPRYVLQPFIPRDDMPDPDLQVLPRTPPSLLNELADVVREFADEVIVRGG